MKRVYFEKLEQVLDNTSFNITEVIDQLAFNEQGLIPVITQDATSKKCAYVRLDEQRSVRPYLVRQSHDVLVP